MKNVRKLSMILVALFILSLLGACSGSSPASSGSTTPASTAATTATSTTAASIQPITLKFSGTNAPGQPATVNMENIAKYVEEKTNGAVKFTLYPSNQLGELNVVLQGVVDGSIDMAVGYVDPTFDPMLDAMAVFYTTTDYESLKKFVQPDTNFVKIMTAAYDRIGVEFLGFHIESFVGLCSKSIPDDYTTVKPKSKLIRIPQSPTTKICMNDLGYPTVSIPWADLYSSLQAGLADGSACLPPVSVYNNFRDIIKYYLPLNFGAEIQSYMISPKTIQKLTPEQYKIIREAVKIVADASVEGAKAQEEEYFKKMEDAGITILPLTDEERMAMAEHVRKTSWPKIADSLGQDTIDLLLEDVAAISK